MFDQHPRNVLQTITEIIGRVKTAMAYVDQYGRRVNTHIGSTDVIPLARAAHQIGISLPPDLLQDPVRKNQYPVLPVEKLVHSLEVAMYTMYGIRPTQAAQSPQQAAHFDSGIQRQAHFDPNQQPPPQGPQYQQPLPQPVPQRLPADFYSAQQAQPQVQPVQPQPQPYGTNPFQPQFQPQQEYGNPFQPQQQVPRGSPLEGELPVAPSPNQLLTPEEEMGIAPRRQDQGQFAPQTPEQQLGINQAPTGDMPVAPLSKASYDQLHNQAIQGLNVQPVNTPDSLGKAESPALLGDQEISYMDRQGEGVLYPKNPINGKYVDTSRPPSKFKPDHYALLTEDHIDGELIRRGMTVLSADDRATKINRIQQFDESVAKSLVN